MGVFLQSCCVLLNTLLAHSENKPIQLFPVILNKIIGDCFTKSCLVTFQNFSTCKQLNEDECYTAGGQSSHIITLFLGSTELTSASGF